MLNRKALYHRKFYLSTLISAGLIVSQSVHAMDDGGWGRIFQIVENGRDNQAQMAEMNDSIEIEINELIPARQPFGWAQGAGSDESSDYIYSENEVEEFTYNNGQILSNDFEMADATRDDHGFLIIENQEPTIDMVVEQQPAPQFLNPVVPFVGAPHAPQGFHFGLYLPVHPPFQWGYNGFNAPVAAANQGFMNPEAADYTESSEETEPQKKRFTFRHIAITLEEVVKELSSAKFRPNPRVGEIMLLRTCFFNWAFAISDFESDIINKLPAKKREFIQALRQDCQQKASHLKRKEFVINQNLRKLYAMALNVGICDDSDQDVIAYIDKNNNLKNLNFDKFYDAYKDKVIPSATDSGRVFSLWNPIVQYLDVGFCKKDDNTLLTAAEKNRATNMLNCLKNGLHLQAPLIMFLAREALQSGEDVIIDDVTQYILGFMVKAYLKTTMNPLPR